MLKITQSKEFKKDVSQYKKDIEKITSKSAKEECNNILNKLLSEYNYIDAVHDAVNKSIDPTKVRENVERSVGLRQQLNKFIKDSKDL
jgi:predicted ATP-binding protein involved in virulence